MKVLILLIAIIAIVYCATPSCTSYCAAAKANCTGTYALYTDDAECMRICAALPLGTDDQATSGNTIGCRTYHANAANSTGNLALHCPHASPSGGNFCGAPCDAYCSIIQNACNATNKFFDDMTACNTTCTMSYNMTGDSSSRTGPNVWCKIYHATAALADPATHCIHASPQGGAATVGGAGCGTRCENYCMMTSKTCTTTNSVGYTDMANCMQMCAALPVGNLTDRGMDSIDCRIYHGSSPAVANPGLHCPHAGFSGGNFCGTWCDVYCDLSLSVCTGANMIYSNKTQCMSACAGIPINGTIGSPTGNHIQCRIYHLGAAVPGGTAASTHCPHATVASDPAYCGVGSVTSSMSSMTMTMTASATKTETGNAYTMIASILMIIAVLLF